MKTTVYGVEVEYENEKELQKKITQIQIGNQKRYNEIFKSKMQDIVDKVVEVVEDPVVTDPVETKPEDDTTKTNDSKDEVKTDEELVQAKVDEITKDEDQELAALQQQIDAEELAAKAETTAKNKAKSKK